MLRDSSRPWRHRGSTTGLGARSNQSRSLDFMTLGALCDREYGFEYEEIKNGRDLPGIRS